jgi:hypothetical protein
MKITKYNEFLDSSDLSKNNEIEIKELIRKGEFTTSSDLVQISNKEPYKKVISFGEKALPYIFESEHLLIWDIALRKITNVDVSESLDSNQRVDFWKKWAKENGY